MKPPDEKTIEELNAAERGRTPRGKWRIIVTVVVILLVLIAAPLLVIEVNRQATISRAEEDIVHEGKLIKARFAKVSDWPKWYRDRKPENWGGDEFANWIRNAEVTGQAKDRRSEFESRIRSVFSGDTEETPPTKEELEQFLSATASMHEEAAPLLRFDCLSLVPEFENGLPAFDSMSALWPMRTLVARAFAYALLESFDRAWQELDFAMQLCMKLTHPSTSVDHMVVLGPEYWVHDGAGALRVLSDPPRETMDRWSDLPSLRKEISLELAQAELAWVSQLFDDFENIEWDYLYMWGEDNRGWFAFLDPKMDWDERRQAIEDPANLARMTADWFRELREYTERLEAGGDPSDWRNETFDFFKDLAARTFEMERRRESTELMAKASLALADGVDVSTVAADYPHHEVLRQDTHWVIRLRYTSTVTGNTENSYESEAEFYEDFRPIRIPVTR